MKKMDIEALSYIIDENALKAKYEEAIKGGCSPEFAKSFVAEVAKTMASHEAASMAANFSSIEALLDRSNIF